MNVLELRGTSFWRGHTLGRAQAEAIQKVAGSFSLTEAHLRRLEPFFMLHLFPDYMGEIAGMARGSGVEFEELLALNFFEADLLGCTNIISLGTAGMSEDKYLVHNEDGPALYQGKLSLVKSEDQKGRRFLALNYPGLLCGDSVAVTSAGLVFAVNYLMPKDLAEIGFSASFLARALLDARDLQEVRDILATHRPRSSVFHWLIYSRKEETALSVEVLKDRESYLSFKAGTYFHTNHFIHGNTYDEPEWDYPSSRVRLERLFALVDRKTTGERAIEVLADHEGEWPLCRHGRENDSVNLASVVVDLEDLIMFVAEGPTCQALEKEVYLEASV